MFINTMFIFFPTEKNYNAKKHYIACFHGAFEKLWRVLRRLQNYVSLCHWDAMFKNTILYAFFGEMRCPKYGNGRADAEVYRCTIFLENWMYLKVPSMSIDLCRGTDQYPSSRDCSDRYESHFTAVLEFLQSRTWTIRGLRIVQSYC